MRLSLVESSGPVRHRNTVPRCGGMRKTQEVSNMASQINWKSAVLASAVAGLFVAGSHAALAADDSHPGQIKCEGVNSCKGQGSCKTAHNSCAGQNGCKGQSHVWLTPEECAAAKAKLQKQ